MSNSRIIQRLESSNSRLFKEEVLLKEMDSKNDIFFEGLRLAFNKLLTFGVKQIPESQEDGMGLDWGNFKEIANKLLKRQLTGHAARDKIQEIMKRSKKNEWNFFIKEFYKKT